MRAEMSLQVEVEEGTVHQVDQIRAYEALKVDRRLEAHVGHPFQGHALAVAGPYLTEGHLLVYEIF